MKREGDGATPVGAMAVLYAYRRGRSLTGTLPPLPLRRTGPSDGWCDEPTSGSYNRPVRLPFRSSAETMERKDSLYDLVVVLDWNLRSRARNRGSAIFLHLARQEYAPTEGCIAVSRADMRRLAPFLVPGRLVMTLR